MWLKMALARASPGEAERGRRCRAHPVVLTAAHDNARSTAAMLMAGKTDHVDGGPAAWLGRKR